LLNHFFFNSPKNRVRHRALFFFNYGDALDWALVRANAAALAVIVVHDGHALPSLSRLSGCQNNRNRSVGASALARAASYAFRFVDDWLHDSPPAGFRALLRRDDDVDSLFWH
jgi:hypothetical protein